MGRFLRDCKGAVTVFVTLLLIPAILISGTGVDLARVYGARSVLQDANQLGANSVLASYDALLQDLYGLFGVMKDDEDFARMADKYIQDTVLTPDGTTGMGTFQLFYGSDLQPGEVTPAADQHLKNTDVLRRQIEEYAKFRAPVIIIEDVLDNLNTFGKVKADSEVIHDKLDIDDKLEDIDNLYQDIYDCIQEVNRAGDRESDALTSVHSFYDRIRECIDALYRTRQDYTDAMDAGDEEWAGHCEAQYEALLANLHAWVKGGDVGEDWDGEGDRWRRTTRTDGLNKAIGDRARELEDFIHNNTGKKDSLDELVALCRDADKKRAELEKKVNDLKAKLNSGQCSDELAEGLKPVLEKYELILSRNLEVMAQAMYDHDQPQLQAAANALRDSAYGPAGSPGSYSRDFLGDLRANQIPINYILNRRDGYTAGTEDTLDKLHRVTAGQYQLSFDGTFERFESGRFRATKNPEFYQQLQELYQNSGGNKTKKKNILQKLGDTAKEIKNQFTSFLEFDPAGAYKYEPGSDGSGGTATTDFGGSDDWSSDKKVKESAKKALSDNLIDRLSQAATAVGDKVLLLTYDTEMFSCYATPDGDEEGKTAETTMSGIPLGVDVNYYFQSELEYLYNGNLKDARSNLKAVTCMIFLVRFVFDYISSFTVPEVQNIVNAVEAALAEFGPFAIVAGELVRLVLALGESAMDVGRLKNGAKVALIKGEGTWRFSPAGIVDMATSAMGDVSLDALSIPDSSESDDDGGLALSYKDYLRLFLLLVNGDTLAQRTANLIGLNLTNKKENLGDLSNRAAREAAMKEKGMVDLSNAVTGFSLTTRAQLRMLFLSMPFAQRGVDGVVPPGTLALTVTDYRGY